MTDFIGASEIATKTEMLTFENKIQNIKIQATKIKENNLSEIDKLKQVCQEFESIFIGYLLKQMRKTIPEDPLFGNSIAKEIFYEMHDEALARDLAKAGGIGLASILYNQLSKVAIQSYQKNMNLKNK